MASDFPTLKDIADAAGVSVPSVSKALNNKEGISNDTKERILKAVQELGYEGRSGRIEGATKARLYTLEAFISNDAFYGDIFDGINAAAKKRQVDLQMHVFSDAQDMIKKGLSNLNDDPLLLVGIDAPEIIDILVENQVSAVIVNGMDPSMRLSSISPDYHFGAWIATRYLIELGHRDIIHVTHDHRETVRKRIDGFREALEDAGIPYDPKFQILDLENPQNISVAARDIVYKKLKARKTMPTGIFCVNDMVALGVIQAVQDLGLSVPDDVSVIGFDGLPMGAFSTPSLSSVQTDRKSLGQLAISLFDEIISDPSLSIRRITCGVELLKRQSTSFYRS